MQTTKVSIRSLVERDYKSILDIDCKSYVLPWTKGMLYANMNLLSSKCTTFGKVALSLESSSPTGFIIYRLSDFKYEILRLAVHPDYRRQYIATQLVNVLKENIARIGRKRIMCRVFERDLSGQLFLRRQGFTCVRVHKTEGGDEYYEMEHKPNAEK